ncbi:MAG TPA: hypothetical protein VIV12_20505 [Streptosporangiaceae bacterium]
MDTEDCLRSLTAEALLRAHPDRPLFPVSLGFMAVANTFVMLGLQFAFWIGLALPVAPVVGLARTALILLCWSSLSRRPVS